MTSQDIQTEVDDQNARRRDLAYAFWEQAGQPHGRDLEFWDRAGQMLSDALPGDGTDPDSPSVEGAIAPSAA